MNTEEAHSAPSGIKHTFFSKRKNVKLLIITILLILSVAATYWCHHVLHVEVVFTHLFYLPITLAGIWWGKNGTLVAIFLGSLLLISHAFSPLPGPQFSNLMRILMFVLVGLTVGWLSDRHDRIRRSLIELNKTKDKFFSIISHDLRSPFQTLLVLSEELCDNLDKLPKDRVKEYAEGLCVASRHLFELVEDLLRWSKIETGTIEYQPAATNLKATMERAVEIHAECAAKKNIRVVSQVPEDLTVWADQHHVRCILRNLISNAIKFTPPGGEVRIETSAADKGMVTMSVTDTGVGIAPERLGEIYRVDTYHTTRGTDNEKGSGLGLVLCKELVEKNGGTLSVKSVLGEGSTFSFTLHQSPFY